MANLALRGLTMASKFLLLIMMTRALSPEQVGTYGLFVSTVGLSLYLLGMEFHVVATRDLLAKPTLERAPLLRDQAVFHLLTYAVALPLLLAVFAAGVLPWRFAAWFYGILVLEHLSQEAYRLLVTFSRPVLANVALFLRGGAWIYLLVAMSIGPLTWTTLAPVWFAWGAGGVAGLAFSAWQFRSLSWREAIRTPIHWPWLRRGLRATFPFVLAALAARALETIDRYVLATVAGEAQVGVYTFYFSMSSIVHLFAYTGVVMVLHPGLIRTYQNNEFVRYSALRQRLAVSVAALVSVLGLGLALGIRPLVSITGDPLYGEHLGAFYVMLAAQILLSLAYVPLYDLYVRRKDKAIMLSSFIALALAVGAHLALVPRFHIMGTATASLLAITGLLTARWMFGAFAVREGN